MINIKNKIQSIDTLDIKKQRSIIKETLNQIKDLSKIFDYLLQTFLAFDEPNKKLIQLTKTIIIQTIEQLNKWVKQIEEDNFNKIKLKIQQIHDKEKKENIENLFNNI